MVDRTRTSYFRQLVRQWALFGTLDFIWMTRDLRYFTICTITEIIVSIGSVTGAFLLAERFQGIGIWNPNQVLFLLGYSMMVAGLTDFFCGFNINYISRRIGRGQLDHVLIQPQPIWLTLLTEGFIPFSGSPSVLTGAGLMGWAICRLSLSLSSQWLGLLLLHLAASTAITLSFSFLYGSLAFWAPRAAEEISTLVMSIVHQLKSFPLDGLSPMLQGGLLSILPVGFVAWYPCRYLLGLDRTIWSAGLTPAVAVVLSTLALSFFLKGLRYYGKTGSQRYLSIGHRR